MTALMGLATRLKLAKLMLITDLRGGEDAFRDLVSAAFAGGVDVLQIRDPHATDRQLADAVELARQVASSRDLVSLAHRVGPGVDCGVDVFHVRTPDSVADARTRLHQFALVGRSVHSEGHLDDAAGDPGTTRPGDAPRSSDAAWPSGGSESVVASGKADYLLVGPVFGDASFPDAGLGLVESAAERFPQTDPASVPWFAVGSITLDTVARVLDAGAFRVAVAGGVVHARDPRAAAEELRAVIQARWDDDPAMERVVTSAFRANHAAFRPDAGVPDEPAPDEPTLP